jgi:hypothetical protein
MDEQRIRQEAKDLDDAIEKGNIKDILPFFSHDCKIELFGIELQGEIGLIRALEWMYNHLSNIKLTPVVIMVENSTFFEEFIIDANTTNVNKVKIKQAEVLEYDKHYKVRSLRLYFDRLLLGKASATNIFEKWLINQVIKSSVKGLE